MEQLPQLPERPQNFDRTRNKSGSDSQLSSAKAPRLSRTMKFSSTPSIVKKVKPLDSMLFETTKEDVEPTEDAKVDLDSLTDDVLFPGFKFESRRAPIKNPIDPFGIEIQDIEEEQKILKKYTQNGSLSVFKGKKEMAQLKERTGFKNHFKSLQNQIERESAVIAQIKNDLDSSKQQKRDSEIEIEKIKIEIIQVLENFGISFEFQERQPPKDLKLMMSSQYRLLLEKYEVHQNIIKENAIRIPILSQRLLELRKRLEGLQSEEYRLEPISNSVYTEELNELKELGVIAKHRYLENERKRQQFVNRNPPLDAIQVKESQKETQVENQSDAVCNDEPDETVHIESDALQALDDKANSSKVISEKECSSSDGDIKLQDEKDIHKVLIRKKPHQKPKQPERHRPIVLKPIKENVEEMSVKELEISNVVSVEHSNSDTNTDLPRNPMQKETKIRTYEFDPPKVHFKDYTVGVPQKFHVRLINMAGGPNSFKLVSIPDELSEYVEIDYTLPGRMVSASVCHISLMLKANIASDGIESKIEFLAVRGGSFYLPIQISKAECLPFIESVSSSNMKKQTHDLDGFQQPLELDFGNCVVGDEIGMTLNIVNGGSISSDVDPFDSSGTLLAVDRETEKYKTFRRGPFFLKMLKGGLGSYDRFPFKITFRPEQKGQPNEGNHVVGFSLRFKEYSKQLTISCTGTQKQLPFYCDRDSLDFNWCIGGKEYEGHFVLWNKYPKMSRKYWIEVPESSSESKHNRLYANIPNYDYVMIYPNSGFVQPNSSVSVSVKFKVPKSAIRRLQVERDGEISFRVDVCFIDASVDTIQKFSVMVLAKMTTCDIEIRSADGTDKVDFGPVSIFGQKEKEIVIENVSKFPQVVDLFSSEAFRISTESGIAQTGINLEPLESVRRLVIFEPKLGIQYKDFISCKTDRNEVFTLECSGKGTKPPVEFIEPFVTFGELTLGSSSTKVVTLKRATDPTDDIGVVQKDWEQKKLKFKLMRPNLITIMGNELSNAGTDPNKVDSASTFMLRQSTRLYSESKILEDTEVVPIACEASILPTEGDLTSKDLDLLQIWPTSGTLEPGQKMNLQVTAQLPSIMVPEPNVKEEPKVENPVSVVPQLVKSKSERGRQKNSLKPQLDENTIVNSITEFPASTLSSLESKIMGFGEGKIVWLIPCVFEMLNTDDERLGLLKTAKTESALQTQPGNVIYLQIETRFKKQQLQLMDPISQKVEFATTAVGRKSTKKITIKNCTDSEITLKQSGLSPFGPFELCKAIRSIKPQGIVDVFLSFKPSLAGKFFQTLKLSVSEDTNATIQVFGEAIHPNVKIEPDELFLGDVCVGDTVTQKIKISNNSPIVTKCNFSFNSEADQSVQGRDYGSSNLNGKTPFVCPTKPMHIEPFSSIDIDIQFRPDLEHPNFYDQLLIKFDFLDDPLSVFLSGRGWEFSSCVLNTDMHPKTFTASGFQPSTVEYETAMRRFQLTAEEVAKEEPTYLSMFRHSTAFETITLKWVQVQGSQLLAIYPALEPSKQYWRVPFHQVTLANLKPFFKLESGKKAGVCEYSIEPVDGTFIYDDFLNDYIHIYKSNQSHPDIGLELSLEPMKGTVDLGGTKTLIVETKDSERSLWHQSYELWSRLESQELTKIHSTLKMNTDILSTCFPHDDSQANELKRIANRLEIEQPVYMESVFRIRFKNSYRFVDPKGIQPERIVYLKVRVEPPS